MIEQRITDIAPIDTTEKLEKILNQVNPAVWMAAQLKTRGYSIERIYNHFGGEYSLEDISYMIKQATAVNHALAIQNPDMLRQLLIDEIEDVKQQMYNACGGEVTPKVASVFMKMVESKAKLLGLNAPEVKIVDVGHTIRTANETLAEKRENFRKNFGKIIDVTPEVLENE